MRPAWGWGARRARPIASPAGRKPATGSVLPMIPFRYVDGILHAEEVDLTRLAAEVGTPFYCYSSSALEHNYRAFAQAVKSGT